jgi:hypothetical protein
MENFERQRNGRMTKVSNGKVKEIRPEKHHISEP